MSVTAHGYTYGKLYLRARFDDEITQLWVIDKTEEDINLNKQTKDGRGFGNKGELTIARARVQNDTASLQHVKGGVS